MTRKLKAMGLVLIAALAMSAADHTDIRQMHAVR